jgi:CDP-diacylglycerol--glycerol-3-phosphate 3-phosphatidyltransferase
VRALLRWPRSGESITTSRPSGAGAALLSSIYSFKPHFQNLLRPLSRRLARAGVTPNAVTLAALALSVAQGAWLALEPQSRWPLLLLPVTLFLRLAFNAIDGMLAREHNMVSARGLVLNELGDVISDAALYLPFALIPGVDPALVVLIVVACLIAELTGLLAPLVGAPRRYAGPFGKSDRAIGFGLLAVLLGAGLAAGPWTSLYLWLLLILAALTVLNRARGILAAAKEPSA